MSHVPRDWRQINSSGANGFLSDTGINLGYTENVLVSERGIKSQEDINPSYHQLHKINCCKEAPDPEYCLYVRRAVWPWASHFISLGL